MANSIIIDENHSIDLLFNLRAFGTIEREVILLNELKDKLSGTDRIQVTVGLIRVMGNEALRAEGHKQVLTDEWLMEHLSPIKLGEYQMAIMNTISDGMKSEYSENENASKPKVRDLVLEELEKK